MKKEVRKLNPKTYPKLKEARVAAYARVSSGSDAMLQSLAAQVNYYNTMIRHHPGWSFSGVYSDKAYTGTKSDRAGFQALLAECRAGNIDMVLTKSVSRFARNTVVLLQTVRELKALGVDIFFEEQNIHTISSEGELMLTILAGYAEEESRSVSENMKWRVQRKFEEGTPWNCTILGYRLDGDHFILEPNEAEVVTQIFEDYLAGKSINGIATALNNSDIPTRKGGLWRINTVKRILRNPAYTGNLLLQTYYSENYLTKKMVQNKGERPMYQATNTHESLISEDTFSRVQSLLDNSESEHVNTGRRHQHYPFTGLITCEICGKKYRRKVTQTGPVWICRTFNSLGKAACPSKQIPESVLYSYTKELPFDSLKEIIAHKGNRITFCLKNGTEQECIWKDRSRTESWTPEMKEAARQAAIRRKKHA